MHIAQMQIPQLKILTLNKLMQIAQPKKNMYIKCANMQILRINRKLVKCNSNLQAYPSFG